MIDILVIWLGYFCLLSLLILILVLIQTWIYWYLQRSQYFWLITFLYLRTMKYYSRPEAIKLKSPDGKYYHVVEVKNE